MSSWSRLFLPPVEAWFSRELQTTAKELGTELEAITRERAALDQARAELLSADPADAEIQSVGNSLASRTPTVLQRELQFRRRCADFFDRSRKEYEPQIEKAQKEYEAAEGRLRAGLVGLGYVEASPTEPVLGKILPGMILSNPIVRRAKDEMDSLAAKSRDHAFGGENSRAIDELVARLSRAQRAAASGP
jgi:hypothetical protein